jgi:hypothetical protein
MAQVRADRARLCATHAGHCSSTAEDVISGASDALTMGGGLTSGLGDSIPSGVGEGLGNAGAVVGIGGALVTGDVGGAVDAATDELIARATRNCLAARLLLSWAAC